MSKIVIKGPFATGTDVVTVHRISKDRRVWLDEAVSQVSADALTQRNAKSGKFTYRKSDAPKKIATGAAKRVGLRPASKVVGLRAKKK